MDIMTLKVALSPVAMLIIANTMRRKLKGFAIATARRDRGLWGRSVARILRPCFKRLEAAISCVRPDGSE